MKTPPPPWLPTTALACSVDEIVACTAAVHASVAEARACFECTLRPEGDQAGFFIAAGIEPLLDALEKIRFTSDELDWLKSVGIIDDDARKLLKTMQFACDVEAPPEGTVVFPGTPILTVEGPYWQAQLVSSLIRASVGSATVAATHAARARLAAGGSRVIESVAASAHGLGGNPLVARAAYLGGASATTSALAARRFKIPLWASMPLGLVLASRSESEAFRAWLSASAGRPVLRLDYRDRERALEELVRVLSERAEEATWEAVPEVGVEIGEGDHLEIARALYQRFEAAGLATPRLFASGGLDERRVAALAREASVFQGYVIDSLGVGDDASAISYDMVALEAAGQWTPRVRLGATAERSSNPGRKFVVRYFDKDSRPVGDVSHAIGERVQTAKRLKFVDQHTGFEARLPDAVSSQPLLRKVMRAGRRVDAPEALEESRRRAIDQAANLHQRHARLDMPTPYPVGMSSTLDELKHEMLAEARS